MKEPIIQTFAARLIRWRAVNQLSQSQAAAALGANLRTLQSWEHGRYLPGGNAARLIEQAMADYVPPAPKATPAVIKKRCTLKARAYLSRVVAAEQQTHDPAVADAIIAAFEEAIRFARWEVNFLCGRIEPDRDAINAKVQAAKKAQASA